MYINYKDYVYRITGLVVLFLALLVALNWLIDSYGIWGSPRFRRMNEHIYNGSHERLFKMIQVAREAKIETLYLGVSTVKKALYPQTYYDFCGYEVFNAAFDAAHILEMEYTFQQTVFFHPELSEVVLCWILFNLIKRLEGRKKNFQFTN